MDLERLYEDNHLLVLNKPPLLPTMGAEAGRVTLLELAKADLKRRYQKPGNVYLGVVSRLDAHASGAIVFARTSKAAARLTEQFRLHRVDKRYWAWVEGLVEPESAAWRDWVLKNDAERRMETTASSTAGAQEARLSYRTLRREPDRTCLEIALETGRKHQIRVQAAARNHPLLGDRKYGGNRPWPVGIALHCHTLTLEHPTRRERMTWTAAPPASWGPDL